MEIAGISQPDMGYCHMHQWPACAHCGVPCRRQCGCIHIGDYVRLAWEQAEIIYRIADKDDEDLGSDGDYLLERADGSTAGWVLPRHLARVVSPSEGDNDAVV